MEKDQKQLQEHNYDDQINQYNLVNSKFKDEKLNSNTIQTEFHKLQEYWTSLYLQNNYLKSYLSTGLINPNHTYNKQHAIISQTNYFTQSIDQITESIKKINQTQFQKIKKKLSQNYNFQIVKSYCPQLTILEIESSKYYQVVILHIQISYFKTKVYVLNQHLQSHLHLKGKIIGYGSFGNIYMTNFLNKTYAIKCLMFKRKLQLSNSYKIYQNVQFIKEALKQYFYLKLLQALQIGPKLNKIYGFDILLTPYCIQFSMEMCRTREIESNQIQQVFENLRIIHSINLVHRDIKPANVMFSPHFNKFVFIDCGGMEFLKQTVGYKTLSRFYGTTLFCSQQIMDLLGKKQNYVDLYYNDLYGLKKTIIGQSTSFKKQLQQSQSYSFDYISKVLNNQGSQIVQNILVYQLMSQLYFLSYQQFDRKWKYITKLFYEEELLQIQHKLLNFYVQLQPNDRLLHIYHTYFSQYSKDNYLIKNLSLIYKSKHHKRLSLWIDFEYKQKMMQLFVNFYKYIFIRQIDQQIQELQLVLLNRNRIQHTIYSTSIIQNNNADESKIRSNYKTLTWSLEQYCYVILKYITFSQNLYAIDINQKLKAVNKAIETIKQTFSIDLSKLELCFTGYLRQLQSMVRFIQFFIFYIWKTMHIQLKRKSFRQALSFIILLGYPIHHQISLKSLLINFIDIQANKVERILFFWEFYLICSSFRRILYNRSLDNPYINVQQANIKQIIKIQQQLMEIKPNQDSISEFFNINHKFYQYFFRIYRSRNVQKMKELQHFVLKITNKQLQISQQHFKKWKLIMFLMTGEQILNDSVLIMQQQQSILQYFYLQEKKVKRIPLYSLSLTVGSQRMKQFQLQRYFIKTYDYVIYYKPISQKFLTHKRIQIAYSQRNQAQFSRLITILANELTDFSLLNLDLMCKTLDIFKKIVSEVIQNFILFSKWNMIKFQSFQLIFQKSLWLIEEYIIVKFPQIYYQINQENLQEGLNKQIKQQTKQEWSKYSNKNVDIENKQLKYSNRLLEYVSSSDFINNNQKEQQDYSCAINTDLNSPLYKEDSYFIFKILQYMKDIEIDYNMYLRFKNLNAQTFLQMNNKSIKQPKKQTSQLKQSYIPQQINQLKSQKQKKTSKPQYEYQKSYQQNKIEPQKLREKKISQRIKLKQFMNIQKVTKKYITSIKNNPKFIKWVLNDYFTKGLLLNYQISSSKSFGTQLIQLVQRLFGQIDIESINNNYIQKIPDPKVITFYLATKIQLSKHQNQQYQKIIAYYYQCQSNKHNSKYHSHLWQLNFHCSTVFAGFLYCKKPFQQIYLYLLFLSDQIKKYSQELIIRNIIHSLKQKMWCNCVQCFPKPIKIQYLNQFVQYLSLKVSNTDLQQNYNMALFCFFCLHSTNLKPQVIKRFIKFIFNSFKYLSSYIKKLILSKIYKISAQIVSLSKNLSHPDQQLKFYRKLIYLNEKWIKHQTSPILIQEIVDIRLNMRKKLYENWNLPSKKKQLFYCKIQRFHENKYESSKKNEKLKHTFHKYFGQFFSERSQ